MNGTRAALSSLRRSCLVAFLVDFAHYLVFGALPFLAIEHEATPFHLGLLPTLYAVPYVVLSIASGRWSDRTPRLLLVRFAVALFGIASWRLAVGHGLSELLVWVPVSGIALGLFWSPLQAALSDEAGPQELPRALGWFNLSWSAGKGVGFLGAGILTQVASPSFAILSALVPLSVAALVLYWRNPKSTVAHSWEAHNATPDSTRQESKAEKARRGFVLYSWIANAAAYGVSSSLNVHAPNMLEARGESAIDYGAFLGGVFLVQTLGFAWFAHWTPRYRLLIIAHVTAFLSLVLFWKTVGFGAIVLSAIPLGLSLALSYQASLHASLNRGTDRGLAAGIHEAVLAVGSSVVPLMGGWSGDSSSPERPLILCLVFLGLVALMTALQAVRQPWPIRKGAL